MTLRARVVGSTGTDVTAAVGRVYQPDVPVRELGPFLARLTSGFYASAILVDGVEDPAGAERALARAAVNALALNGALLVFTPRTRSEPGAPSAFEREAPEIHRAVAEALAVHDAPARNIIWNGRVLPLSKRAHVMGIVNVTPDSFSDGGRFFDASAAVKHGIQLASEGADILDVGGESTRPGAEPVAEDEEIRRVVPVIEGLVAESDVPVSIDTTKASVARAALDAGAQIVNDVGAGRFDPAMLPLCAERGVPVILMHMLGEPRTMQQDPRYGDVVRDVYTFLAERADAAVAAGVDPARIVIDPGFGFGKTREHNLILLRRLREFRSLGYPVLAGTSRKSFIGATLDVPVADRLEGTAATVAMAVVNGAAIVRVHDCGPMRRVAGMVEAVLHAGPASTDGEG